MSPVSTSRDAWGNPGSHEAVAQPNNHAPTRAQTARNVAAIWANRVLGIAAPLILTPIILRELGLEATGIWLIASQLASHLMLLDVGLGTSLIRMLARSRALDDDKLASEYLATAFYTLAGCGALLLLLSVGAGSAFVAIFDIQGDLAGQARLLGVASVVFVACSLPLRIGTGMLGSGHRFDRIQIWDALGVAIRLCAIVVIFAWAHADVVYVAAIVFGSSLFTALATFVDGKRVNPHWSLSPAYVSRPALTVLLSMSGASLLATAAAVALTQAPSILTGYMLEPRVVPLIAYPLMIFTALTPFFNTFGTLISPLAAGLAAQNKQQEILPTLLAFTRYLTSAALVLFAGVLLFGEPALSLWLSGPQITAAEIRTMAHALAIILGSFALATLAPAGRSILSSVGRHWSAAVMETITATGGLVVGVLLMQWTDLGVVGMAIGVAVALCWRGLFWTPLLLARYFDTTMHRILLSSFRAPFAAAAVAVLGSQAVRMLLAQLPLGEWIQWGLTIATLGAAWLWCTWLWVMLPEHRGWLLRRLSMAPSRGR